MFMYINSQQALLLYSYESIETLSNPQRHHRESLACGDGNAQVVVFSWGMLTWMKVLGVLLGGFFVSVPLYSVCVPKPHKQPG